MNSDNQVSQLENRIAELENQNRILQEKVAYLTHKLFGRSSEQTSSLGIEGQMSIFDEAEAFADPEAVELALKDVGSYRCRKFTGQREELLKDIPHEKKLCTLVYSANTAPCARSFRTTLTEDENHLHGNCTAA